MRVGDVYEVSIVPIHSVSLADFEALEEFLADASETAEWEVHARRFWGDTDRLFRLGASQDLIDAIVTAILLPADRIVFIGE